MNASELRLFVEPTFSSPYVMSVFVVLHEKGIPFEMESIDLGTQENLRPEYRRRSLTCRVPTLEHGNFSLSESSAITEYLDEIFPSPKYPAVYPRDPVARAKARQVQAWLRSDLVPIREERPTSVIFDRPIDTPLSEKASLAAGKLFQAAEALLQPDRLTLVDEWCIADTDLALMLNRLVVNGDDVPEHLATYAQQQWRRPSVQAWVAMGNNL